MQWRDRSKLQHNILLVSRSFFDGADSDRNDLVVLPLWIRKALVRPALNVKRKRTEIRVFLPFDAMQIAVRRGNLDLRVLCRAGLAAEKRVPI